MENKIKFGDNTATEQLRRLSVHLGGDFIEDYGSAKCILDNDTAKGRISSYDLVPGLAVRTYDVTFFRELRFSKDERASDPLYFLYGLKGNCYHHFGDTELPVRLEEKQNVIIKSGPDVPNEVILPAGIRLKLSVIFLTRSGLATGAARVRPMEASLRDVFAFIDQREPYRYLGEIDLGIAKHATILIDNERTDIVGKMITEGAAMNIMAKQIQGFERKSTNGDEGSSLSKRELSRIAGIADYMERRMSERITMFDVSMELAMPPRKVQKGIKELFDQTFGQFVLSLRLEHARRLFLTSDMNVSEIASEVGINSKSYFSKIFRERFGTRPSAYRQYLLGENALFELSYRSVARADISQSDIKDIVQTARRFNHRHKITGCLVHHGGTFFQILEGPKRDVLQLMERIGKDRRHHHVDVLWKGPKAKRLFAEWSMALVSEKGTVDLPVQGSPLNIDLECIRGELREPSLSSDVLWRRVRNVVRATG